MHSSRLKAEGGSLLVKERAQYKAGTTMQRYADKRLIKGTGLDNRDKREHRKRK
jgi:hypothetical protein